VNIALRAVRQAKRDEWKEFGGISCLCFLISAVLWAGIDMIATGEAKQPVFMGIVLFFLFLLLCLIIAALVSVVIDHARDKRHSAEQIAGALKHLLQEKKHELGETLPRRECQLREEISQIEAELPHWSNGSP